MYYINIWLSRSVSECNPYSRERHIRTILPGFSPNTKTKKISIKIILELFFFAKVKPIAKSIKTVGEWNGCPYVLLACIHWLRVDRRAFTVGKLMADIRWAIGRMAKGRWPTVYPGQFSFPNVQIDGRWFKHCWLLLAF